MLITGRIDSTATEDYVNISQSFTLSPTENSLLVDIIILNDNISEQVESFSVILLLQTSTGVARQEARVEITDDDGMTFKHCFAHASFPGLPPGLFVRGKACEQG